MRPHLLFPDRDLPDAPDDVSPLVRDLIVDLELESVIASMSGEDPLIADVCAQVLTARDTTPDVVRHRQDVLADVVAHTAQFQELYATATEAIAGERKIYRTTFEWRSEATLRRAVRVLRLLLKAVVRIREVTDHLADDAGSAGVLTMCRALSEELDDEYLQEAEERIDQLELSHGLLVAGRIDDADAVSDMRPRLARLSGNRLIGRRPRLVKPTFSYTIADRDQAGMEALSQFRDRSLTQVAYAADTSATHILTFLKCLQRELAFYLGCVRLRQALTALEVAVCVPTVVTGGTPALNATSLYDVPLALQTHKAPIPVTVLASDASLVVLTGANRGGKSTALRAMGIAQLMAQAGAFVAAEGFDFSLSSGIFTHFKREEDDAMEHGKFDEELERMSRIVGEVSADGILLANESFASTNEQEASDVGFEAITALLDSGVRVVLVTHLFTLAKRLYDDDARSAVFLRAERGEGGERPYRLSPAPPLRTSFGSDIYRTVFGVPLDDGAGDDVPSESPRRQRVSRSVGAVGAHPDVDGKDRN